MFIRWFVISQPHYPSMEPGQNIAYISDVGAYALKPLFITGCAITTVFLDLSFAAERYLRHTGRLARNTSLTQKVFSWLSIFFAVGGSAGLILLAVFDTYRHPNLHDGFLLLFMAGFLFSAICICVEYQRLGIHYRNHRILRISFWVKLTFILVELGLAAAFAATSFRRNRNAGAILEWIVALVFTGYIVSFLLDLLPSVRTKRCLPQGWEDMRERGEHGHGLHGVSMRGAGPGEYEQDLTRDSSGPMGNGNGNGELNGNGYQNGVNGYTKDQRTKPGWANKWRNF
jgi:Frag1/DRAM/Sfk1 family